MCVVAWDAMSCVGSTASYGADPREKALRFGSAIVAKAGLSVNDDILRHYLRGRSPVALDTADAVFEFFLQFWRDLREQYHFVEDQADRDDPSPFADLMAEFLVASPGGLFRVKEILSVTRFESICALGSGAAHAEGAAWALLESGCTARDVARRAMEIALRFDRASGGEIRMLEMP